MHWPWLGGKCNNSKCVDDQQHHQQRLRERQERPLRFPTSRCREASRRSGSPSRCSVRRGLPQQAAVLRCPEHDRPACVCCRERRRGVRNYCRLGHHKGEYRHQPRLTGLCLQHSVGACPRCKINKRSVQYCCGLGHHRVDKRKPGPRPGSKRGVPSGDVMQERSQRRRVIPEGRGPPQLHRAGVGQEGVLGVAVRTPLPPPSVTAVPP